MPSRKAWVKVLLINLSLKNLAAAIAGWRVISIRTRLERIQAKNGTVLITPFAPLTITSSDANKYRDKVLKDLWFHFTEEHGGFWDNQQSLFECYEPDLHSRLNIWLIFWVKNVYLLNRKSNPITNPLWLRSQSGAIVQFEARSIASRYSMHEDLEVSICSSSDSLFKDIEERLVFLSDNIEFAYFDKGRKWKIFTPSVGMRSELGSWANKVIDRRGGLENHIQRSVSIRSYLEQYGVSAF